MASLPLTPGVYNRRQDSGVRAISGVGTSVAVFIGETESGPVGTPTRIFNITDYTRVFGGPLAGQEIADSVRLFYLNGGGEAWIVRVAGNPQRASTVLNDDGGTPVLTITARDVGTSGNAIAAFVDRDTSRPGGSFNLTLRHGATVETFSNLSMDSGDSRYVVRVLNNSMLVRATRAAGLTFPAQPSSTSGTIADLDAAIAGTAARSLTIAVNAIPPITITLAAADFAGGSNNAQLTTLAAAITTRVIAASPAAGGAGFAAARSGSTIVLTASAGESAQVRVLPTPGDDLAPALNLGAGNGGVEVSSAGARRPAVGPDGGALLGAVLAGNALDALPAAGSQRMRLILDRAPPIEIDIGATAAPGAAGALATKLANIAARITAAVNAATGPGTRGFLCSVSGGNQLELRSGSQGAGSSVVVAAAPGAGADDPLAGALGLLAGTRTDGADILLGNGRADPLSDATRFNALTGPFGLGCLNQIDGFNLLLLPGVTDSGVLAAASALAVKRRAFLLIDAPEATSVSQMEALATGTALPKSENAAIYFPRIMAADPLNGGRPRAMPPSGAIAGLYARTDAARGVWKAPAGTDAAIVGAIDLDTLVDDDLQGVLNPIGVNCVRTLPVYGAVAWGARTLKGSDAESHPYKYVPVSRLALFLESSLNRGLQWVVFEPNDETLWSQIRLNVGAFMDGLYKRGAFAGASARDAYFVKCDAETTTPTDQALGTVNVVVGFAPLRPAEFVIITLQQIAGQSAS